LDADHGGVSNALDDAIFDFAGMVFSAALLDVRVGFLGVSGPIAELVETDVLHLDGMFGIVTHVIVNV
jgi:hypothetical protein